MEQLTIQLMEELRKNAAAFIVRALRWASTAAC